MTAATITLFSLVTIQFLIIGAVVGYLTRDLFERQNMPYIHPEMLDEYGNVLPDEILAIRFEHSYGQDWEWVEEED